MQDWASHLEHWQSILIEFDASGARKESTLIQIFRDGFKLSIAAQMEQRGQENDTWEELVKKAIKAEAKVSLFLFLFVRDIDQRCPRGNRLATLTKSQTSSAWDPRDELSKKAQNLKPSHSWRSENSKTSNPKARKEKKKKYRREQAQKDSGSTPATSVNMTEASGQACKDMSQISYYNCTKKGHYSRNCPEPKKNASKN